MRVFVDASAWIGMEFKRDQWHLRARHLLGELARQRSTFVTSSWTLYEALTVLRHREPRGVEPLYAAALRRSLVVRVEPEVEAQALDHFRRFADKSASVVDHANLLVAVSNRCEGILSFDDDFRPLAAAAGLRVLR